MKNLFIVLEITLSVVNSRIASFSTSMILLELDPLLLKVLPTAKNFCYQ